jgi:hypothetical protein
MRAQRKSWSFFGLEGLQKIKTTGEMMTTFTTEDRLNAESLRDLFRSVSRKVSRKDLLKSSPSSTPYMTATGIQIGKYYEKPRYVEEDSDMLRLQSYLIGDPTMLKRQYWTWIVYKIGLVLLLFIILLVNK